MRRRTALASLVLLAACAGAAGDAVTVLGDAAGARRQLAQAAAQGPVTLLVLGNPDWLSASRIAALAGQGVRGIDVTFTPHDGLLQGERLVLAFGATGAASDLCAGLPAGPGSGRELQAAFCEGLQAVAVTRADATGLAPRELERLIWHTTARLFPDDYAETYGFDLFGWRVRLGGEASF